MSTHSGSFVVVNNWGTKVFIVAYHQSGSDGSKEGITSPLALDAGAVSDLQTITFSDDGDDHWSVAVSDGSKWVGRKFSKDLDSGDANRTVVLSLQDEGGSSKFDHDEVKMLLPGSSGTSYNLHASPSFVASVRLSSRSGKARTRLEPRG